MTIEKLPSGSYRIKQMYEGKYYSITVPTKPTKKDAAAMIAEKLSEKTEKKKKKPFEYAAQEYITSKENILSPRTIREYGLYVKRLPEWFTKLSIWEISQTEIQQCINELSKDKSPKTVRCFHGFISAVLTTFRPEMIINTTLPQKVRKTPNIPDDDEVKTILQYTKEHAPHFYVALVLACYSCRRSEICALKYPEDINGNVITINKALVEDKDGFWVVKTTKTTDSTREIIIPQEIADIIHKQGYFYKGSPQSISNYLKRTQKQLNIDEFSLHKLRHYFASKMLDMGVDQKTIQELGGWKGNEVLSTIYQHSMLLKSKERKQSLADKLSTNIL